MRNYRCLLLGTALLLCCMAAKAESAVVYSGKLNQPGPDFNIDIDRDGTPDFITAWSTWAEGENNSLWRGFDTDIVLGMQFMYYEQDDVPVSKAPLPLGYSIGPQVPAGMMWDPGLSDPMLLDESPTGYENDVTHHSFLNGIGNKYLGFALSVGSSYYYGWIQLHVDEVNNVRLIDYAYENVPGMPIKIPNTVQVPTIMLLNLD